MSEAPVRQELEESLSALVDGEVTELELRRLLKADDDQYEVLRKRWSTYQVASASLKQDTPNISYTDLSSSISAAIADEAVHSVSAKVEKPAKKQSLWAGVGRFAVAASVAGAVVVGVQFAPDSPDNQIVTSKPVPTSSVSGNFRNSLPSDTTVSTVSTAPTAKKQESTIQITESTKQQMKDAEEQVNRLMLEHAQNATQNTQQGVLSYERVPETK